MIDKPKMPELRETYISIPNPVTAKYLACGDKGTFDVKAMRVDGNRNCWIDPLAVAADVTKNRSDGEAQAFHMPKPGRLNFERLEGGFKIACSVSEHKWEIGPKPDPKTDGGMDWYPVVEFFS